MPQPAPRNNRPAPAPSRFADSVQTAAPAPRKYPARSEPPDPRGQSDTGRPRGATGEKLPSTVRNEIKPLSRNSAKFVCGMPLPRASGGCSKQEVAGGQTAAGGDQHAPPRRTARRVHARGQSTAARINATTTKPTITPKIRLRTIVIWSSRLRNRSSKARTLGPFDFPRGDFLLTVLE